MFPGKIKVGRVEVQRAAQLLIFPRVCLGFLKMISVNLPNFPLPEAVTGTVTVLRTPLMTLSDLNVRE